VETLPRLRDVLARGVSPKAVARTVLPAEPFATIEEREASITVDGAGRSNGAPEIVHADLSIGRSEVRSRAELMPRARKKAIPRYEEKR